MTTPHNKRCIDFFLTGISRGYLRLPTEGRRVEWMMGGYSFWATESDAKALRAASCPSPKEATSLLPGSTPVTGPAPINGVGPHFAEVQDLDCEGM